MVDRCVICGAVIPEGREVCPICEHKTMEVGLCDFSLVADPGGGRRRVHRNHSDQHLRGKQRHRQQKEVVG